MGGSQSSVDLNSEKALWVKQQISNGCVVIFSKTSCPYCRMAKKVFSDIGQEANVIELNNRRDGGEIQDILQEMTGARTVGCFVFIVILVQRHIPVRMPHRLSSLLSFSEVVPASWKKSLYFWNKKKCTLLFLLQKWYTQAVTSHVCHADMVSRTESSSTADRTWAVMGSDSGFLPSEVTVS